VKRVAPDPEFVLLYRKGIPTSKIATLENVAETTVPYHLQITARAGPSVTNTNRPWPLTLDERLRRAGGTGRRHRLSRIRGQAARHPR
jgi:hypothetical protein